MARSMVVAGKAGTAVFFMVTLMAAATLVTRALRAIVALATASQDMPALAGMMASLDMAEAGMVAGLDMAAEAGMVAGATTDDQDQEVRQQQPAFTRTAAKYIQTLLGNGMVDIQGATHSFDCPPAPPHRGRRHSVTSGIIRSTSSPLELFMLLTA